MSPFFSQEGHRRLPTLKTQKNKPKKPLTLVRLFALLACAFCLASGAAQAQTSTPVYGSDTAFVEALTPSLRLGASSQYNTGEQLLLGQQGQFVTSFGSAYDPNPVDLSQGFVSRFNTFLNGSNGIVFVIKNPSVSQDSTSNDTELGAFGIPEALGVAIITQSPNSSNANNRHIDEVDVFTDDAQGNSTDVADITGLDLNQSDPSSNFQYGTIQVRYIPKFNDLDVYIGQRLVARVGNIDLAALGITQGGQAELGFTSGNPPLSGNTDYFPAYLNHWSVGNQLVFGAGFGPNYYEDRFPFLTTGQSVWGHGKDSVDLQKFVGASSHGQTKTSNSIGTDFSIAGQDIFSIETSAFASYDVGIGFDLSATGGTADISYPLFLDMLLPSQYSVKPGGTFTLPISYYADLAASINTTSPSANATADLKFNTDFGVNLDTSVLGKSIASGQLFDAPVNLGDHEFFNAQTVINSGLIPDVSGGVNYAGYFQDSEGETGKKSTTEHGEKGKGTSEGSGKGFSPMDYVSVNITVPDLSTSGQVGDTTSLPNDLTSSADEPFVSLQSDFTNSLLQGIPGFDILTQLPFFNNDYTLNLDGYTIGLGFHIADLYGSAYLGTKVSYDFKPQPLVYLILDPVDPNHPLGLGPFTLDPTTNKVIHPPTLTMPTSGVPLTITPEVVITKSQLQTVGSLTLGGSLAFDPFDLYFQFGDLSLTTEGQFGWPYQLAGDTPAVTYTTSFGVGQDSGGVANAVPFQTFLLGKPFTLFPTASPNPMILSVTPNSSTLRQTGADGPQISLTCQNASSGGSVIWDYDGVPGDQAGLPNRKFVDTTQVEATLPDSLLTVPGIHTLTLINQNTDAVLYPSNSVAFVVSAPAPRLNSITPETLQGSPYKVLAGGPSFNLKVHGSQFIPPTYGPNHQLEYAGSVVEWNGKPLVTTYEGQGELFTTVPANLVKTVRIDQITVVTGSPGGGTSNAVSLAPLNPVPTLTSLSQSQSNPGLSSLALILNGVNFLPNSYILWDNGVTTLRRNPSPTKNLQTRQASLILPLTARDLSTPGTYALRVVNPGPGGGTSQPLTFTVGQFATGGSIILIPEVTLNTQNQPQLQLTVVNTGTVDATDTLLLSVSARTGQGQTVYPSLPDPLKPLLLGTIPVGKSITPDQTFTFPASLGTSGQAVLLTVGGSSSGKAFTSHLRVVLP